MSEQVESLDAAQALARAVECWKAADRLLGQSGDLVTKAEALRKNSVVQTIETSRWLCEAFNACKPNSGEWSRLFDDPSLPPGFSKSNCDRLRPIWGNATLRAALGDSAILPKLPPAAFTLAALAPMDPKALAAAIERGDVHPKMTKEAAERLASGVPSRELPPIDMVRRALKGLQRQLAKTEPPAAIAKLIRQVVEEMYPEAPAP